MELTFKSNGFMSAGCFNLTPREAASEVKYNDAIIVDIRSESMVELKKFEVPLVIYIPFDELKENYDNLPLDKPLIFADSEGLYSCEAVKFVQSKGFVNVANLSGGLAEWERNGLSVVISKTNQSNSPCPCQNQRKNRL
ncbi:MAG: rhodanese-like domain-containing protein [Bacteroidales bacterium]